MKTTSSIWFNGCFLPWQDARVHVMSHALHYGSAVFEGIRCYATPEGPAIFRLRDHVRRLFESARIYRMAIPFTEEEIAEACRAVIRENRLTSAYLRPIALRGVSGFGVAAPLDGPVEVAIAAIEFGAYLGEEGLRAGIDACVSSWNRAAPNTFPAAAKAAGNYLNSQLIAMEARANGFAEGIALAPDGTLSEGSGENLFLVHRGVLHTPPASSSILVGITRDTVFELARDLGLSVVERPLPREMLYLADEVFMTGTAAEITPVRSVDRRPVGNGAPGPVTAALQERFFGLFDGRTEDRWGWLDPVRVDEAVEVAA
ncbi:MAG: branched chain amino acid aminotransferase [Lysobacteraceae bacterium]|nr:MAG: branched chain amino acid aminotransferase [Xanthomonadaceae bacterium]